MKSFKKSILFGFLVWLMAFVIAFAIFPIRENNRPLFEAIMPVVLSVITSFFAYKYFKTLSDNYVKEGVMLGIIFILVNWIIDAVIMLSPSPMQMTLLEYFQDIGLTYFMILPITIGMGFLLQHQKSEN